MWKFVCPSIPWLGVPSLFTLYGDHEECCWKHWPEGLCGCMFSRGLCGTRHVIAGSYGMCVMEEDLPQFSQRRLGLSFPLRVRDSC